MILELRVIPNKVISSVNPDHDDDNNDDDDDDNVKLVTHMSGSASSSILKTK